MKLKFVTLGILFSLSFAGVIISSEEIGFIFEEKEIIIKMPDEQTLQKHLRAIPHFEERTNIVNQLANQQLSLLDFQKVVNLNLHEFAQKYLTEQKLPVTILFSLKIQNTICPFLYEALLANNKEILDHFKKLGIYQPKK